MGPWNTIAKEKRRESKLLFPTSSHLQSDATTLQLRYVTWSQGNFGPQIMAKAKEKGVARLALKSMALTK